MYPTCPFMQGCDENTHSLASTDNVSGMNLSLWFGINHNNISVCSRYRASPSEWNGRLYNKAMHCCLSHSIVCETGESPMHRHWEIIHHTYSCKIKYQCSLLLCSFKVHYTGSSNKTFTHFPWT